MLTPVAIVAATIVWEPLIGVGDLDARVALASAIAETSATDHEALLLARIALFESRYTRRVVNCAPGTTKSGRGAFGVIARAPAEYAAACGYTVAAAELALARVRESRAACPWLPERDSLTVYAAGRCRSKKGRALSRQRWVAAPAAGGGS